MCGHFAMCANCNHVFCVTNCYLVRKLIKGYLVEVGGRKWEPTPFRNRKIVLFRSCESARGVCQGHFGRKISKKVFQKRSPRETSNIVSQESFPIFSQDIFPKRVNETTNIKKNRKETRQKQQRKENNSFPREPPPPSPQPPYQLQLTLWICLLV